MLALSDCVRLCAMAVLLTSAEPKQQEIGQCTLHVPREDLPLAEREEYTGNAHQSTRPLQNADSPVASRTALRWVGLAFIPSSLLMGVTAHLTTDLARFRSCGSYR